MIFVLVYWYIICPLKKRKIRIARTENALFSVSCELANAKFGTCTVGVSVNGILIEDKMRRFKGECAQFSFNKSPFILTTVQVPNLALTHTKRITRYIYSTYILHFTCFSNLS
jgi:hypothetical protein